MHLGNLIWEQPLMSFVARHVREQRICRGVLLVFGKIAKFLDGVFKQFGHMRHHTI